MQERRRSAEPTGHRRQAAVSAALLALVVACTVGTAVVGAPGIGILAAALIVGAVLLARRGGGWRTVGLSRPASWPRTLALAALLGVIIQLLFGTLLEPLIERLTGTPTDLQAFDGIRGNFQALLVWLGIVWVLVAFLEELIFRGFLITELAAILGRSAPALMANVVLTSAVFGLVHWYQGPSGIIGTALAGLLLAVIFVRAGFSLWLPILVHGFIDTVGLILIYLNADRYLQGP